MDFDAVIQITADHVVEQVAERGEARGRVLGARHGQAMVDVGLRPFGRGEAAEAIFEVVCLCVWLGVDQVAVVVSGRAHHLDDPAQSPGTVLMVERAEAHDGEVHRTAQCWPLIRSGTSCVRGPEAAMGPSEGPIGDLLAFAVSPRAHDELRGGPADAGAEQVAALSVRGHDVGLSPQAAAVVGHARLAAVGIARDPVAPSRGDGAVTRPPTRPPPAARGRGGGRRAGRSSIRRAGGRPAPGRRQERG